MGEYVDVSCGGETIAVGDVVTLSHSVDVWPGVPHHERGEYVGNFVKGRFVPLWEIKTMNVMPCITMDDSDTPQWNHDVYQLSRSIEDLAYDTKELKLEISDDIRVALFIILGCLFVFAIWFAWVVWVMS